MERDDPAYGGQNEYTPFFLKIYDPVILGFFTRVVWRCPTRVLVDRYRRHIRPRHLDVGPGPGYFLEQPACPRAPPLPSSTRMCTSSIMHPGAFSAWTS